MNSEAKRYTFIQEKSGLSKKDFAESLGLSKSHGFQIGMGRLKPSREVLERLSSLYKVNLHWFITGKGSSGLETDTVEVELLALEAAAGGGREVEDYPEIKTLQIPSELIAPFKPEQVKAMTVSGDSMTGEHIFDGDLIFFVPGSPRGDGIYVVSIGNTLVVKQVAFGPQSIDLISANPAYPIKRFKGQKLEEIRIVGKVISNFHRL